MSQSITLTNTSKLSVNINLQQIYEDEEEDNVVYSIREEIIQNVLTAIDKISLEKRVIRFVAECACDAMKKLISIHFYYRPAIPDLRYFPWAPDEPIAPSPPDTWATKRVPVQPRSRTEVMQEQPEQKATVCNCDLGVECLCYLDAEGRIKDQLETLYATKTRASRSSPSTMVSDKMEVEELGEEEEDFELSMDMEDVSMGEVESEKCMLREGFSKIGFVANAVKLPKIELPPPMIRGSKTEILELPPIRVDANYHSQAVDTPRKKTAKKKKKK